MKKLFNIKTLGIIAFTIFIMLFCKTEVKAANVSISCNNSVEVNSPITIKVTGTGVQWCLRLIVDGKVIASSCETVNYNSNIGISFSGTYTPTSTGNKTIKLEGSVTEYSNGSTITEFEDKNIIVKEKSNTNNGNNDSNNNGGDNNGTTNNNGGNNGSNEEEPPGEGNQVTTALSQDNTLKALSVNVGTLTPKFSPRTTKYTVDVGEEVTSIKISATKNNSKAKVTGAGTKQLNPGANTFEIEVRAENGWTEVYTVVVNKPEEKPKESELKLSELKIKGINTNRQLKDLEFTPEFSEDVYTYNIDVAEDIEALSIDAIPKEEGTIVEILGNEDLVAGENIISIIVKSQDEEKTATYKIIVNKKQPVQQVSGIIEEMPHDIEKNKSLLSEYCIPIVVFTITVAVLGLIFAIVEYKHSKKEQGEVEEKNEYNTEIALEKLVVDEEKNNDNFSEIGEDIIEQEEILNVEKIETVSKEVNKIEENEEYKREPETEEYVRRERQFKKRGKGKHF